MVRLPLATIVRAAPDRDRVEIVVGSAAISLQCAKLKLFKIPGSVSGGILGKGGLVSFIPNQMQHEPVSVAQGTPLLRTDGLVLVSSTPKGRGVFASKLIPAGTVVEVCPVLVFTDDETTNHVSKTCLDHYTYYWPSPHNDGRTLSQALALGLGSMFNHSTLHQNVVWTRDLDAQCITYTALRDIAEGEELCISYGNGRLWFEDAEVGGGGEAKEHDPGQTPGELELAGLERVWVDVEEEDAA